MSSTGRSDISSYEYYEGEGPTTESERRIMQVAQQFKNNPRVKLRGIRTSVAERYLRILESKMKKFTSKISDFH